MLNPVVFNPIVKLTVGRKIYQIQKYHYLPSLLRQTAIAVESGEVQGSDDHVDMVIPCLARAIVVMQRMEPDQVPAIDPFTDIIPELDRIAKREGRTRQGFMTKCPAVMFPIMKTEGLIEATPLLRLRNGGGGGGSVVSSIPIDDPSGPLEARVLSWLQANLRSWLAQSVPID